MKLKVVYFTFIDIGSTANGGTICCRNHLQRLSEDTGIELFAVVASYQSQEADALSYLKSLGVSGKFIPFKKLNPTTKVTLTQKLKNFAKKNDRNSDERFSLQSTPR